MKAPHVLGADAGNDWPESKPSGRANGNVGGQPPTALLNEETSSSRPPICLPVEIDGRAADGDDVQH